MYFTVSYKFKTSFYFHILVLEVRPFADTPEKSCSFSQPHVGRYGDVDTFKNTKTLQYTCCFLSKIQTRKLIWEAKETATRKRKNMPTAYFNLLPDEKRIWYACFYYIISYLKLDNCSHVDDMTSYSHQRRCSVITKRFSLKHQKPLTFDVSHSESRAAILQRRSVIRENWKFLHPQKWNQNSDT